MRGEQMKTDYRSIALDMACIRLANAMNSKAVAVKAIEHKGATLLVKTTQYKSYKD